MKSIVMLLAALIFFTTDVYPWYGGTTDTVETKYPNGQLEKQYQRFTFNGNERTYLYGFYRAWYENGQLDVEGHYIKDREEGTWVYWDSTGQRIREVTYVNGLKHGKEIEWNANGTMSKELCFKDNKLHGLSTWFRPGNNIIGEFNNYYLTILIQRYYVDGVLLLSIKDSILKANHEWLVGGREPYYNEAQDLWVEWNKNNTEFHIGKKVDEKKEGVWVLWSETGEMLRVDYFLNGDSLK